MRIVRAVGSFSTRHAPEHRELIRYIHKNGQLYNQLSRSLPRIVGKTVAEAVQSVLAPRGLRVADVAQWAIHGGGESIIASLQTELGLPESKLQATRRTLAQYGNVSSLSVLFALREILDHGVNAGDWCMLVSFGAGLSAHVLLLQAEGA